ncbi:MAG TPA: helix-turn-helix domain-containing protein [Clostridiales bacterium]|nr:helix-turn-helix domain-containing protein [Clostridiales bacterium]
MNEYVTWQEVKASMTSLTEEEKQEIDMMSEIISQIIVTRQEMGISQRELEKLSGVRQEAICRMEKAKNLPQLDTLVKLMIPLGLQLSVKRVNYNIVNEPAGIYTVESKKKSLNDEIKSALIRRKLKQQSNL